MDIKASIQDLWFKISIAKQAIESIDYVNNRLRKWKFESFITLKCVDKFLSDKGKLVKEDIVLKYKLFYYNKSLVGIDYDAMAIFTYMWTSIDKLISAAESYRQNLFNVPSMDPTYYVSPTLGETIWDVNWFLNKSSFYHQKGITFKRSYLLLGPPGTGKSKFIDYIKRHTELNKEIVNVRRKFAKEQVKYIRDNDAVPQAKDGDEVKVAPISIIEDLDRVDFDEVELSGLLNFLDGDEREGLLFITCNDETKIPDVILRPGRVDVTVKFDLLNDEGLLFIARNIFSNGHAEEVVNQYKANALEFDQHLDRTDNVNTPAHFTNYCTKKLVSMRL